jgi:hypothetical protein
MKTPNHFAVLAAALTVGLGASACGGGKASFDKACDPSITLADYQRGLASNEEFEANIFEPKTDLVTPVLTVEDVYQTHQILYPLVLCSKGVNTYVGREGKNKLRTIPARGALINYTAGSPQDGSYITIGTYSPEKVKVGKILNVKLHRVDENVPGLAQGFALHGTDRAIYGQTGKVTPSN